MSENNLVILIAAAYQVAGTCGISKDAPAFRQQANRILSDMLLTHTEFTVPRSDSDKAREQIMQLGRPWHHGENNAGF